MSQEVQTHHVQQYADNITLRAQQKASRLLNTVQMKTGVTGRRASFDQVGQVEAQELNTRHADTPLVETPHSRRWANLKPYALADLIDEEDVVRVLVDPQSSYVRSQAAAIGRRTDRIIITAMGAAADAGQEGGSSVAFLAGQAVAVDYVETGAPAASNLTAGKLRRLHFLLNQFDVEEDDRHIAITASQLQSLLRVTEVTSSDFNTVKALVNGEINTYLGFMFHRLELLPKTGNNRTIYAWHRDAVGLAVARLSDVKTSIRDDKNYATQVYAKMDMGGVRIEEERIASALCDETL